MPGMRSSVPGMSPAKIAMALAATMAPIAGTGSMKKVTGTSSAVAMVAVSPGIAPTNRPNTDGQQDHQDHVGIEAPAGSACSTAAIGGSVQQRLQQAERQRHQQQLG